MVIGAPEHVWLQHNPRIPRQHGGTSMKLSSGLCFWLVLPYDPDLRVSWLDDWVQELTRTILHFDFPELVPRVSWASGYRNLVATVTSSYFQAAREG